MASIRVRKIDEDTLRRLRIQAANHGNSMEEEVRQILIRAVSTRENLGDLAVKLFSPTYSNDALDLPERATYKPVKFG